MLLPQHLDFLDDLELVTKRNLHFFKLLLAHPDHISLCPDSVLHEPRIIFLHLDILQEALDFIMAFVQIRLFLYIEKILIFYSSIFEHRFKREIHRRVGELLGF